MTPDDRGHSFGGPEDLADMQRAFAMTVPEPPDLEDVALGLFEQLTPDERERFRLIWARLCAVGGKR
jgi:hypothetical protein